MKHVKHIWYFLWNTFSAFTNLKLMDYLRQRWFLTVLGYWTVGLSFMNLPGVFWIHLHFWHPQYPMARSSTAYLLTATPSCLLWGWLLAHYLILLSSSTEKSSKQQILIHPGVPPMPALLSWFSSSLVWVKFKKRNSWKDDCVMGRKIFYLNNVDIGTYKRWAM